MPAVRSSVILTTGGAIDPFHKSAEPAQDDREPFQSNRCQVEELAMFTTLWTTLKAELKALHEDERGQGIMEYALMFITLAALAAAALVIIANGLSQMGTRAVEAMP